MSTRLSISLLIGMTVASLIFGIGATIVLAVPSLSRNATFLLPMVVVASFALAPFLAWIVAPTMRARHSRRGEARRRLTDRS